MKQRQPAFEINDDLIIVENRYGKLTLALPPQPSYFFCKTTKRLFGMIAGGDCTASEKKEDVSETENWQIETLDNGDLLLKRSESSAVWKKKIFCLRVTSNAFCWYHELEGEGKLEDLADQAEAKIDEIAEAAEEILEGTEAAADAAEEKTEE